MVEVFKTNVQKVREAKLVIQRLKGCFPAYKINFDLKDCDKILRVEGHDIPTCGIIDILKAGNYECILLE